MKLATLMVLILVIAGVVWIGCNDNQNPAGSITDVVGKLSSAVTTDIPTGDFPPPSGQVGVEFFGSNLTFWPYTGVNFSGTPQDPINLIFYGNADPRDIRAALLSLDGDRTAFSFPDAPPWNCAWDDAIGDVQVSYGDEEGWTGGVVQLACGPYGPLRFHIRLFKIGLWTVGNAHFEMLIPGTADHEVLSWERAEELVTADLYRSGLLDETVPQGLSQYIDQSPFRQIPDYIYNELPVEIRGYIEGPLGDIGEGETVPVVTDGIIPIFNLVSKAPRVAEVRVQDFTIEYGQYIPKPFCGSSPEEIVYVEGPVNLYQETELTGDGYYRVAFRAEGELTVAPIYPPGEPLTAVVKEHHDGWMNDYNASASSLLHQNIVPASDPNAGSLLKRLRVSSNGLDGFQVLLRCPGTDEYVEVTGEAVCQPDLTSATSANADK